MLYEEVKKDKMYLFMLIDEYFAFLELWKNEYSEKDNPPRNPADMAHSPELLRIKKVFSDHVDALNDNCPLWKMSLSLVGDGADKKKVLENWLPQLMLFNLRVLDIYDSAMNGMTVDEMIKTMQDQKIGHPKEPQTEEEAIKGALGGKMLGQFGRPSFWQHRYDGMGSDFKPHDWYLSWSSVGDKVWKTTKLPESKQHLKILNLGCGNSHLAEDLLEDKSVNIDTIYSIDFIESVIRAQQERANEKKLDSQLKYIHMDVLTMNDFPDAEFDLIIDKGTMDSVLMTATAPVDFGTACKQISRVLKPGGWFVLISCAIGFNQVKPLQNLTEFKWRVTQVIEMPSDSNPDTKINVVLIQKFSDSELKDAIEEAKKQKMTSSLNAPPLPATVQMAKPQQPT